nr:MAG TPA: hypothetical protein [Caudoviricetes sp.]
MDFSLLGLNREILLVVIYLDSIYLHFRTNKKTLKVGLLPCLY